MNSNRIKAVLLSYLLLLSGDMFAQSPGGIGNQLVWVKGNFSSGTDQLSKLNFNPATNFDNCTAVFKIPRSVETRKRITVFTVYQDQNTNDEKKIWDMTGDQENISLSTHQVLNNDIKSNIFFAKNNSGYYEAANPEAIINTYLSRRKLWRASENSGDEKNWIRFGNPNLSGLNKISSGMVAEFILYEKILNEEEIAKVETYLALKYGITLQKNYLNASGKTVWNWQNDKAYSNNIAGIARDDRSSLYQKQATGYNNSERLVIGVNAIAGSNSESTGQINNGDYLVWGDNAQFPMINITGEERDDKILLSGKKWLMRSSGGTAGTVSTQLKIDTKAFYLGDIQKKDFYLVIDRSGSDNFAGRNYLYILPDSISADGIAVFNNLLWDTDRSGKDCFTFGFRSRESNLSKNKDTAGVLSFQVFPNPVSDGHYKIAVTLNKPVNVTVLVYDMNRQLIDTKKGAGSASYFFSGYINAAAGAYTVKLVTPEAELSRIIILQ